MAGFVTNVGSSGLLSGGTITWASDTIMARLTASSFTPDQDNTSMTGYTAIGTDVTLGAKQKATNTTDNRIQFTNTADLVWTAVASGTVRWVTIYKFVTNDAGSTPIAIIDITSCVANGSDITLPAQTALFYSQQ